MKALFYEHFKTGVKEFVRRSNSLLVRNGVDLIMCEKEQKVYSEIILESLLPYLLNGAYSIKRLLSNALSDGLLNLLEMPTEGKYNEVKKMLKEAYKDDPVYKGEFIVAQLVRNSATKHTDISGTIKNYFWTISDDMIDKIREKMEWR